MKKKVFLAMSLALAIALAACGNDASKVEVIEPGVTDTEVSELDSKKEALEADIKALEDKKAEVLEKYNNGNIPKSDDMDSVIEQTQLAIDTTKEALLMELTVSDVDALQEAIDLLDSTLSDLLETFKED